MTADVMHMKQIFVRKNKKWNLCALVLEDYYGKLYTHSKPIRADPNFIVHEPVPRANIREAINAALTIAGED